MTARFKTVETLFEIKTLQTMMEEEKQRAEFIKLHKKSSNVTKRECDQDMEKQGTDP